MIGQTISHYRIVDKVGGEGMGVVYKADWGYPRTITPRRARERFPLGDAMQCDECGYPLSKENVPSIWKESEKHFFYVCREMRAAVSEREWFKTPHNEWLEEQRRRWRTTHGSSEDG